MTKSVKLNKKNIIQRYIIEAIDDFYEKDANGNIINNTEMPDNELLDTAINKKLQKNKTISPSLRNATFAQLKQKYIDFKNQFKEFNKQKNNSGEKKLSEKDFQEYLLKNGNKELVDAYKEYKRVNKHAATKGKENKFIDPARREATKKLQDFFGTDSIPMTSNIFSKDNQLTKKNMALYAYDYSTNNRKLTGGGVDSKGRPIADVTSYVDKKSDQKKFINPDDKKRVFKAIKEAFGFNSNEECNDFLISKGRYDLIVDKNAIPNEKVDPKVQKDFVNDELNQINVQIKKNDIAKVESELSKYGFDVALTGKIFSYGNSKLPPSTLIINLTSATACPSGKKVKGQKTPECPLHATVCYAHKGERMYGNEYQRNTRNDVLLRKLEPQQFAKLLHAYLMAAPYRITDIRISENGDIRDQETLNWCEDLAGYVRKRYGINTATYTHKAIDSKTFKPLDFSNIHNLVINSSHDMMGANNKENPFYKFMNGTTRNYLVMLQDRTDEFNSLKNGYDIKTILDLNQRNDILKRYLSSELGFVNDSTSEERDELYQKIVNNGLLNESTFPLDIYVEIVKNTPLFMGNDGKGNRIWKYKSIHTREVNGKTEHYWKCSCDCSRCRFCYNTKAQNFELYDDPQERTNTYVAVH